MSQEYALSRVKDALEKSGGNHAKAQRLILTWLLKDPTLLYGLTAQHIQSIITHAIIHATQPPKKISPKKINLKDQETSEFGDALLDSLRGDTGNFGEASPVGLSKPGKASKAHIDALTAIAQASKNKKKK